MAAPWAPLQISSGLSGSMNLSGETIRFGTHWNTLMRMVEAERTNEHQGQSVDIIAARDRFYKGAIARDVAAFPQEHQAPFELSDFADFCAKIEPPAMTTYRGYKIYKLCSAARGRSLLQALNILEPVKGFGTITDSNSAIRQFEKDVHTSR